MNYETVPHDLNLHVAEGAIELYLNNYPIPRDVQGRSYTAYNHKVLLKDKKFAKS